MISSSGPSVLTRALTRTSFHLFRLSRDSVLQHHHHFPIILDHAEKFPDLLSHHCFFPKLQTPFFKSIFSNNSVCFDMAEAFDSASMAIPTPCMSDIKAEKGSEQFHYGNEAGGSPGPGIRRLNLRAEIDTSPPFGSVKEAVTHFGGSGSWVPLCKFGSYNGIEELEKDIIVKELQALDVLEELGATKTMVAELKRQLQTEAATTSDCLLPDPHLTPPAIKEIDKGSRNNVDSNIVQIPDIIIMELKQAKLNLSKTMNDLEVIQTDVENLTRKMRKEKIFLEKRQERMASVLEKDNAERGRLNSKIPNDAGIKRDLLSSTSLSREIYPLNPEARHFKTMANYVKPDASRSGKRNEQNKSSLKTAELRWVAAKRMEEAAKAAEAVALAEIEALSGNERSEGGFSTEPEKTSLNFKEQSFLNFKSEGLSEKSLQDVMDNTSKLAVVENFMEATKEVNLSKQALEEALYKVQLANRKQLIAEEALGKLTSRPDKNERAVYYSTPPRNYYSPVHQGTPLDRVNQSDSVNNDPKPVLRPSVSMKDVLSRKQALPQLYAEKEEVQKDRQKVALSQMLRAVREDLKFSSKGEKDGGDQRHFAADQRKKFGFIHVSLPLSKLSKKKMQTATQH